MLVHLIVCLVVGESDSNSSLSVPMHRLGGSISMAPIWGFGVFTRRATESNVLNASPSTL